MLPLLLSLNGPKVPIALAVLSNEAPPDDEPVSVPAVIVAVSATMCPVEVSESVPVPRLTAPVTFRFALSTRVTLPLALSLNGPKVPMLLAAVVNEAPPTDEPVRVEVVIRPVVWLTAPAETRSTVPGPPVAFRFADKVSDPPLVVVSVRVLLFPASTTALTVRPVA